MTKKSQAQLCETRQLLHACLTSQKMAFVNPMKKMVEGWDTIIGVFQDSYGNNNNGFRWSRRNQQALSAKE